MGLKGNGTIPAVYSGAYPSCKIGRHADHGAAEKDIRPRDIMTEKAFMNALTVDMALRLFNKQHASSSGNYMRQELN